ncbi:hypothetical protein TNCT_483961 [Trichonephila clavata]|uniref:Uncharacterized protein n=1 Tax=Trichonephila clavata TaxID=2740835 RepID=A0A8X6F4F8_TRICU|nr:hypothetical protein TNCT_483961 [Trichonephila clavata]
MSMLSSFFNVNKAMDIQPNLSKRKLKTPRNSAPRKVAKTAHLLNPPEDDPPKADVPILEALENQPPLLEKLGTNLDNTLPLLEEMDIENPILEGEPVLKDPPAADHVKLEDPPADDVKLEDPPADHVKLEDPPADPSELDPVALDPVALAGDDAVMVDNYEEPENDEKEEFRIAGGPIKSCEYERGGGRGVFAQLSRGNAENNSNTFTLTLKLVSCFDKAFLCN